MRAWALPLLLLTACPDEKKAAAPSHPASPVITRNVEPLPQPPQKAEVEMGGKVELGGLKAERLVFVVARSACTADSTDLDVLEQTDVKAGTFFTEMFFPQGTVAHFCLIALDARGQQVGFAAYAKNPVKLEGQGEVEFKDLELQVAPVKARAAPKGL